jgi:hypothetical protein
MSRNVVFSCAAQVRDRPTISDLIHQRARKFKIWKAIVGVDPFCMERRCAFYRNRVNAPLERNLLERSHALMARDCDARSFKIDKNGVDNPGY